MRFTFLFAVLLMAVAVAQYVVYYDRLPETVASTFGGAGEPVGWASRQAMFGFYAGMMGLFLVLFGLVRLLVRLPSRWINIPRRDYWLAPVRREATLRVLESQLGWFLVVTLAYLVLVMQLVLRANLLDPPRLEQQSFWIYFVVYMVYATVWTIWLVVRFCRAPRQR